MKLFDTHAHYNDEKFDEDREEIIKSVYEYGVKKKIKPREFLQESYQKRINVKMENKNEQE